MVKNNLQKQQTNKKSQQMYVIAQVISSYLELILFLFFLIENTVL